MIYFFFTGIMLAWPGPGIRRPVGRKAAREGLDANPAAIS